MITRGAGGWQTVLADLSLILFMVTVAALSQAQHREGQKAAALVPSEQGEQLAFYRLEPGAPPLGEWLAAQSPDERQQLTVLAQYRDGQQGAALRQAETLVREAGIAGVSARIIVEPGGEGVSAGLSFDVPETRAQSAHRAQSARRLQLARRLQKQGTEPLFSEE